MYRTQVHRVICLGISVLALHAMAHAAPNPDILAKQCYDLANNVAALRSSQQKKICTDKLDLTFYQMETAGASLFRKEFADARLKLDNAIQALHFAALISCARYIQIVHAKFEAQQIKNALA